jgi:hypothetical protein
MAEESRFEHFDQQIKTRLEHLFTRKQCRSLPDEAVRLEGRKDKGTFGQCQTPTRSYLPINYHCQKDAGRVGKVRRTIFSRNTSSLQGKASVEGKLAKKLVPTDLADRAFAQKRQSRFLYEEVCFHFWDPPTLGDLVDVLRQTLDGMWYCRSAY